MIPLLLGLGTLVFGAVILSAFWEDIQNFIKRAWNEIKKYVVPAAIKGFSTFLSTRNPYAALADAGTFVIEKFFSYCEGQWTETIVNQRISENEIPDDLKQSILQAKGKLVDITKRTVEELKMELEQ